MMQDPTFMNMGAGFDEFIASVNPGNVWPQPEKLRQHCALWRRTETSYRERAAVVRTLAAALGEKEVA